MASRIHVVRTERAGAITETARAAVRIPVLRNEALLGAVPNLRRLHPQRRGRFPSSSLNQRTQVLRRLQLESCKRVLRCCFLFRPTLALRSHNLAGTPSRACRWVRPSRPRASLRRCRSGCAKRAWSRKPRAAKSIIILYALSKSVLCTIYNVSKCIIHFKKWSGKKCYSMY